LYLAMSELRPIEEIVGFSRIEEKAYMNVRTAR